MRRLLCISNSVADTFKWRTSMGLSNHHIRHWSPYVDPKTLRGLSEINNALVWIDRPRLSVEHVALIDYYKDLGMLEFAYNDRSAIKDWLRGDTDATAIGFDDDRVTALALPFLHDAVARLVQIIRVAVTCAAIEQQGATRLADFFRKQDMEWVGDIVRPKPWQWLPRKYD